jgi:uncharacterized protein YjbJ (UPF0337 family)
LQPPGGTFAAALRSRHGAAEYPVGEQEIGMDNDRIKGAVKQKVGEVKEAAGKVLGDEKLKRKGQAEEVSGKVQNIVGGVKDSLRESHDKR